MYPTKAYAQYALNIPGDYESLCIDSQSAVLILPLEVRRPRAMDP